MHVRLKCPVDSPNCEAQPAVPDGDGCDKSLDHWFADWILRLKIPEFGGSSRGLKLKDLPLACTAVLTGESGQSSDGGAVDRDKDVISGLCRRTFGERCGVGPHAVAMALRRFSRSRVAGDLCREAAHAGGVEGADQQDGPQ